jgi:hypothetical protein
MDATTLEALEWLRTVATSLERLGAIITLRCAQGEHDWCERHYHPRHVCQCQCHRRG